MKLPINVLLVFYFCISIVFQSNSLAEDLEFINSNAVSSLDLIDDKADSDDSYDNFVDSSKNCGIFYGAGINMNYFNKLNLKGQITGFEVKTKQGILSKESRVWLKNNGMVDKNLILPGFNLSIGYLWVDGFYGISSLALSKSISTTKLDKSEDTAIFSYSSLDISMFFGVGYLLNKSSPFNFLIEGGFQVIVPYNEIKFNSDLDIYSSPVILVKNNCGTDGRGGLVGFEGLVADKIKENKYSRFSNSEIGLKFAIGPQYIFGKNVISLKFSIEFYNLFSKSRLFLDNLYAVKNAGDMTTGSEYNVYTFSEDGNSIISSNENPLYIQISDNEGLSRKNLFVPCMFGASISYTRFF